MSSPSTAPAVLAIRSLTSTVRRLPTVIPSRNWVTSMPRLAVAATTASRHRSSKAARSSGSSTPIGTNMMTLSTKLGASTSPGTQRSTVHHGSPVQ
jgi:hypothetical protein